MSKSTEASKGLVMRPNDTGYEIGYGKPPKHTRFKKGQSGNPGGRPKKVKTAAAILADALAAPLTIRENGHTRTIDHQTALIRSMVARAIKGDNRATAQLFKLMEQTGMATELAEPIREIVVSFDADFSGNS